MKRTALAIGFSLVVLQAHAISRYTSTSMSCAKVQDTIQRDGAAIMRYAGRSGLPLYDRYVANRTFCRADQVLDTDYIPTADRASCPVNACVEYEFLYRSRLH